MERSQVLSAVAAFGLVSTVTAVGAVAAPVLSNADVVMGYLLVILVVAFQGGRTIALATSAASVAAYNFFFVPPFHTFRVDDTRNLLTFAVLFGVGSAASGLAGRLKRADATELRARTEEVRSALLSTVSHDLRTPLASITGAATALLDEGTTLAEEDRRDLLVSIRDEAARLERLVTNLLEMTRLTTGPVTLQRAWVPLEEAVGGAFHRADAALAGHPTTITLPHDLPLVDVDPVLLEVLLVNLLENAARHTPVGTPVTLSAHATADHVEVEVRDRGPGLPPGDPERLFEAFVRGTPGHTPGSGLGLAICRGVVLAHGGTITASDAPGGGASFRVRLPRTQEPPPVPLEVEP